MKIRFTIDVEILPDGESKASCCSPKSDLSPILSGATLANTLPDCPTGATGVQILTCDPGQSPCKVGWATK